jgi:hypothetical protein
MEACASGGPITQPDKTTPAMPPANCARLLALPNLMQMSQVLDDHSRMATQPPRRRTGILLRQNCWSGGFNTEERPRAAFAFKGDVPVLREPMHVVVVALTTTVVPQRGGLSLDDESAVMFYRESYQDGGNPGFLGELGGLCERCFAFASTAALVGQQSETLANQLQAGLTPSPPSSPRKPI